MTAQEKASNQSTISVENEFDDNIDTAEGSDVLTGFLEILSAVNLAKGLMSVTDDDTHWKTLIDAVLAGTGVEVETVNEDGNAQIRFKVDETKALTDDNEIGVSNKTLDATNSINNGALHTNLAALANALLTSGVVPYSKLGTTGLTVGDFLVVGAGGTVSTSPSVLATAPLDDTGTGGEDLVKGDFVYLNRSVNKWFKVDINATPAKLSDRTGIVNETAGILTDATGAIRLTGEVGGYTGLTPGQPVYASETPGGYTQTKPSPILDGDQTVILKFAEAKSATTMVIGTQERRALYMKRATLADQETLTINHHEDALGYGRTPKAFVTTTTVGGSLTSYSDANQDEDVVLNATGYSVDRCVGGTAGGLATNPSYAFDDNTGTQAVLGDGGGNYTLEYNFGTARTIKRVKLTSKGIDAPDDFDIDYWDGSNWQTALAVTGDGQSWGQPELETRTYDIPGEHSASQWRIEVNTLIFAAPKFWEVEMLELLSEAKPKLSQGFQVSGDQQIARVQLWMKKVGSPTGNLTVRIQTNNSGDPSGTDVTNGESIAVDASTLSTSYGYIDFDFSAAEVSDATPYHIVLESTVSESDTDYVVWGTDSSTPSYTNGEMKSYNGASWSAENKDACFDILQVASQIEEIQVVGGWSSGYRDVGVRFDDGADSDPETNTTFKNIKGTPADLTLAVEVAV